VTTGRLVSVRDRKRVLIFSASFGGGHRSAAQALHRYLVAHYRREIDVAVVDFFEEFAPSLNLLGKFAYSQSVQFFPELYGTFFDLTNKMPTNPVVHELAQAGYSRAGAFIDAWHPHAVISTYPIAGGVVSDIKASRDIVSAMVVTDYGVHRQWVHPATDLFFVASREVGEDLANRGVPWERIVVSGIPIHERFSVRLSRAQCRETLGLEDRFTVLLTAAAGMPGDLKDITKQLVAKGIQVVAVTGDNKRLRRSLQAVERKNPLARVLGYVREMNEVMGAADVLVGKAGGLTVSEALAEGLPLIIYNPIPGQETYNLDFLVNYGAGLHARDEDDVVEKARFLSTHPRRLAQMAENAEMLGKPAAARAVCERVLAAVRMGTDESAAGASEMPS
jgi:processive 1,2-diacylglycerol beta-glucosyltransferase